MRKSRPKGGADPLSVDTSERRRSTQLILVMRGLRSLAYGLLAVLLGVALADEGLSPAAIGILITVSLIGDMIGTYVVGLMTDTWGRRRMLVLLSLLMAGTGVVFGLVTSYPALLVAAFFGTLGTTASETAPFLPVDQAMIAQVTAPSRRTALFALCWLLGTSVREIDMMPRMEQAFLTENPRGEYNQQGLYFSYSWQHP